MLSRRERFRKSCKSAWHAVAVRHHQAVPVFIFGEMRSGTNMLTDCLDRSWRTDVFNESDADAFYRYALRDNAIVQRLIKKSKATHVIFKSLADSARANELLQLLPNAKAIWIYRNYEDVVNSAVRKWTEHNKYLYYILHEPERAAWRARNLPSNLISIISEHYERGLSEVSARALIWYVRNQLLFEQELGSRHNICLIRYEELAKNPASEFKRIFKFLEIPLKESHYRQVSTRSIGRDEPPVIDKAVRTLCEALTVELDNRLAKQREFASSSP